MSPQYLDCLDDGLPVNCCRVFSDRSLSSRTLDDPVILFPEWRILSSSLSTILSSTPLFVSSILRSVIDALVNLLGSRTFENDYVLLGQSFLGQCLLRSVNSTNKRYRYQMMSSSNQAASEVSHNGHEKLRSLRLVLFQDSLEKRFSTPMTHMKMI